MRVQTFNGDMILLLVCWCYADCVCGSCAFVLVRDKVTNVPSSFAIISLRKREMVVFRMSLFFRILMSWCTGIICYSLIIRSNVVDISL